MKTRIRKSSVKYRRKTGFLTRMRTKGGRAIIRNQRRRSQNNKK